VIDTLFEQAAYIARYLNQPLDIVLNMTAWEARHWTRAIGKIVAKEER
jgi:hypothetical protein